MMPREALGPRPALAISHSPGEEPTPALTIAADTLLGVSQVAAVVSTLSAEAGTPLLALVCNGEDGGAWTGPKCFFPPPGRRGCLRSGQGASARRRQSRFRLHHRRPVVHQDPLCAISTEEIAETFIPWLDLYDHCAGSMEYFGHYSRGLRCNAWSGAAS
jgi:hypothetical protein